MKLYVWHEVLCSYTCGVMFALANSEEEARDLIKADNSCYMWVREELEKKPEVYDEPVGFTVFGGE